MNISVIYILVALFEFSNSQWQQQNSYLDEDKKFIQSTGTIGSSYGGYFYMPSTSTTANFITCTTPSTSYITLTQAYPSAENYHTYSSQTGYWISVDLYFQGTWTSKTVSITLGSFTYSYSYQSPTTYTMTSGFCDALPFEVKTVNFTLGLSNIPTQGKITFTSYNTNTGQVSLKNIYISKIQCYPSCSQCNGPNYNQCTSCHYGSPTDSVCPPCPSNQYYWKNQGCKDICEIYSPLYQNGFCQSYQIKQIDYGYISSNITYSENLKWSLIQDQLNADTFPTILTDIYTYGVFQFNSGISRYFQRLFTYSHGTYLIGLKICILTFNDIPINCGIQFKINNTYYGSIYKNDSGIQTHKLKISEIQNYGSYSVYSTRTKYELITYLDIPKNDFLFSAIGNYTVNTAGWGMYSAEITQGYCSWGCLLCEVSFKCQTCSSGFLNYRDGTCTSGCSSPYQKQSGSYCYDFDDETPYSQYLIKEYINTAADPGQYAQYTLISQSGTNFLKGSDIYYSYFQRIRIFGGPFIWSQAKFQRIHNIITPHHSLTIAFYIVYGPTFPSDGNFIYSIENNTPVSKSTASYYSTYSDGAKYDKVYEKINHNSNTLTITWECFGPNNEPIKAYCGFYNYYIAVHNCQPYCLQCSNQSTCTQWNSTYNINIVKFSQAECQINQYYDKESVRCFDCPSSCLTCTSKIDCQTCQPTYTQSKLGCTCTMNQYEDSNQCFNCPIECNQCLSSTYCIECLISNNRQLLNGQCICIDGSFLTNNNICIPICGDSLIVSGEQCENSSILPYKGCINCQARCQSSCLTCSTSGIGCLSCKDGYNRIDNLCYSICGDKIITEDEQCDDGNLIIGDGCHNCQFSCQESCIYCIQGVCYDCQEGYRIISFKCYPICGDGVQKYNEQCDTLQNQQKCKSCQFTCDLNCYFCQFGLCQQCLDGYELSSDQFYCVKSFQYNSIEIENCQIQIGIDFIQCHNYTNFGKVEQKYYFEEAPLSFCQYQHKLSPNLYFTYCFDHCAACDENNCISCQSGYYFNDSFSCISSYGIGILAHDEHCEMDNQNCLSCMFNAPKLCELYFEDTCFKCENGYYINQFTNICESKCGDGIITHDEQCEDNNYIQFDGCYYCKYSCSQQCLNCINGLCQKCNQNYQLLDGFCYVEENGIEYLPECEFNINGECLTCQKDYKLDLQGACISICSESCIQCHYGQCFECAEQYELYENICIKNRQCQKGLYFNQELQICESLCGDGFINGWEECDDQNMQQFDGCYQCKFECDEHCIECIYGECFQCSQEFNLNENKCQSKCQETCLNCAQGGCQLCSNGYLLDEYFNCIKITCQYDLSCTTECGNGIIENLEQCDDQNLINDDSCNNQCEQTCDVNCTQCIEGICYECKEGWRLGLFFCESICGDQILVGNEECDDCNQNSYDGCFQCKFQCTQYCEICLNGICQSCQINYELDLLNNKCKSIQPVLAIYEQPNCKLLNNNQYILCQFGCLDLITSTLIIDYNMNKCSKNCKLCLLSQCLECEFGYYGNKCMPKCGDGIIVQEEECDDGNQYEVDTCLNCKYQCPLYCKLCAYGVCTHCFEGFYLDIVSISCNPICGDTILSGNEACDDGNELTYDGCFKCNYQCQMECLNCFFGKCMECESPLIVVQAKGICEQLKQCEGLIGLYYDDFSNDCLPLCGDGIVVGNEQCEDLNNTPYDGCYDCKYQCQIGSLLNQTSCIPICGDGIVIDEYEECDDQNDQPYDGCFECQFQCIQNCLVCQKGICLKCDIDFSFKNNQCLLNIQNDNIELSQDNNDSIINSQNLQELLFYGNSLCRKSECVYSQKPNMKLTYQDQQFALQYIEITYDEQVKYGDQIIKDQDLFNISISDLDSQNYDITINTIQEMSFDLQYAQYQIVIEIFLQLSTKPVLFVQLNQEIVNENNQTVNNLIESITLQQPKIISEQLKSTSASAQKTNKILMIGAISLSVISLVAGESQIVVETLNLLQYQQYLRFITVDYPENLQIYFQAYDLLSITSYLKVFEIDDYINLITRKEKQIDLSGKFKLYNIEADLFTNILPQLIQFLGLVTLPFVAKKIYSMLFYITKYILQHQNTQKSKIQISIINLQISLRSCIKSLMKSRYLQNYDQIIQLFYINSWDLIFKVILQLYYNQINNLRSVLTSIFATLILFMYISFSLKSLSLFNQVKQKNISVKRLELRYITLDILRTTFFHTVLILFQDEHILQCLFISVSSFVQCYLIYKYKQCSNFDRIILLLVEGILTLFSLSLFLYFNIPQIYFSYENKVILGFFQMSFLILSLIIVFLKQLHPKLQHIWYLITKKKEVKVITRNLFYF